MNDARPWVAGEAAAVLAIRAFLIEDRGLGRDALNLMGYWREGRALDDAPVRATAAASKG